MQKQLLNFILILISSFTMNAYAIEKDRYSITDFGSQKAWNQSDLNDVHKPFESTTMIKTGAKQLLNCSETIAVGISAIGFAVWDSMENAKSSQKGIPVVLDFDMPVGKLGVSGRASGDFQLNYRWQF